MRIDDEFDRGLRKRKAIYMYYLQGVPAIMAIDKENCLWFTKEACRICEKNCDRNAIDFNQKDEMLGMERVKRIFKETVQESPGDIIAFLNEAGERWSSGRTQEDDITFLVIKRK